MPVSLSTDKRRFTRIPFNASANVSNTTGRWDCIVIDISLQGVLIEAPEHWTGQSGEKFQVELIIGDSTIRIRMDAEVAHEEAGHIGFHCKHIDLDSITHLRRLVELNIGDSDILHRELYALGQ